MLAPKSEAEFRLRPEGGYLFGEGWLYFCFEGNVFGFVLWGTPSREGIGGLVRLLELELDRTPHVAFVDVRGLVSIEGPAFAALEAYVVSRFDALSRVVIKVSLAHGQGLVAATTAGFLQAVPSPFPAEYFLDPVVALTSLGFSAASEAVRALERAEAHATGVPSVVRELRAHLETGVADATLERAARALSISTRTLQRQLAQAGVTFLEELQHARIRVAKRMLTESSDPITTVAFAVGCASTQNFSALFRKVAGETPTAFRRRCGPPSASRE